MATNIAAYFGWDGSRRREERTRRKSARTPVVEGLEARQLLHGGASTHLSAPPRAEQIHPPLSTLTDGGEQVTPADIGITPRSTRPVHTHDTSGVIHVESAVPRTYHLGDLFG